MTHMPNILIVEDTLSKAMQIKGLLKRKGLWAETCTCTNKAQEMIAQNVYKVVLLSLDFAHSKGLEVLEMAQLSDTAPNVIGLSSQGSVNSAVEAMRLGAYDFLIHPFPEQRLAASITNALALHQVKTTGSVASKTLVPTTEKVPGFIGQSAPMQRVYRHIESVANSKAPVFILGESGTGKEVTAQAIHAVSDRSDKPFIAINCAAIPDNLMESELFGHVKGAFTGANEARKGAVSMAQGGTLFLDEICEMDIVLQAKLLRFLQTGQIKRVGSDWIEDVNVRIVCATNRNPAQEVEEKRFREDLYYRLNVLAINLPPLRERGDDVVELAEGFLATYAEEERKPFLDVSIEAADLLRAHMWPGNIRELQNTIRKAVVMYEGVSLTPEMLDIDVSSPVERMSPQSSLRFGHLSNVENLRPAQDAKHVVVSLDQGFDKIEQNIIEAAIQHCEGSIPKASRMLGLSPSTIYRKREAWLACELQSQADACVLEHAV